VEIKKIGQTQRLTDKSRALLENVLVVTGRKTGANKIIESALCDAYPLFSEMYDKGKK